MQTFRRLAGRQPDAPNRLIAGRMIDTVLRCLIRMEACVDTHHLNRTLGRLAMMLAFMPVKYVCLLEEQKNDLPDAGRLC